MELTWEELIEFRSYTHRELAALRLSVNADQTQLEHAIGKLKKLEDRYARIEAICAAAKAARGGVMDLSAENEQLKRRNAELEAAQRFKEWGREPHFDGDGTRAWIVTMGIKREGDAGFKLRDVRVMAKSLPDACTFATDLMHKSGFLVNMEVDGSDIVEL